MDAETEKKIQNIVQASKEEVKKLFRKEDAWKEERNETKERLDYAVEHHQISQEDAKKGYESLGNPAMNTKKVVVNEVLAKKRADDIQKKIAWEIKKGNIKPADFKNDPWAKKMLRK